MFRSYFLSKALQLWNWTTDSYQYLCIHISDGYQHARNYYNGVTHKWAFIQGHSLPLPVSHIKNKVTPIWIYCNHTLTSIYQPATTISKFSWLSAKITIVDQRGEIEYDIDSFLSAFRLDAPNNIAPSLSYLFLCWCAETKQWFPSDVIVQFHIIDHNGEKQLLTLGADNYCLVIHDQKIYHQISKRTNSSHNLLNAYEYYHPC